MSALPDRIPLARLPTPLERLDRLTARWSEAFGHSPTIWAKRDDLTGFELSGNKIRKLEIHRAAARDHGAETVVTCGAAQSNHCRATALAAARMGLRTLLLLRTPDGAPPDRVTGNHLLQRLGGAEVAFITPDQYADRDRLMQEAADRIGGAWVIPEGASDWLGMLGFVVAMQELADQIVHIGRAPAAIWHASMSAGTTAGLAWGTDRLGVDAPVVGAAVGDSAVEIGSRVEEIWAAAVDRLDGRTPESPWEIVDAYIGRGYGLTTTEELTAQAEATSLTGMLFDPTYTGKALYALREEVRGGRFGADDHVVYWHTGGGFAAFAHDWSAVL